MKRTRLDLNAVVLALAMLLPTTFICVVFTSRPERPVNNALVSAPMTFPDQSVRARLFAASRGGRRTIRFIRELSPNAPRLAFVSLGQANQNPRSPASPAIGDVALLLRLVVPTVVALGPGEMVVTLDSAIEPPLSSPSDTFPLCTCTEVTTPESGWLLASSPCTVFPIIEEAELIEVCSPKLCSDVCRLVVD